MAKQKIHSTTQDFTEVLDIQEDIVLLKGNNACSILDISSVNFFLLSQDEQNARIYGYMSLLNSLSFPIQILIVSKRIDLTAYVKLLDQRIASTQNNRISQHLNMYKEFIQELIKGGQLLDKKIYIVIPVSPLELGVANVATARNVSMQQKMKEALSTKRNNVMVQIQRIGLFCKVLGEEELTSLFYEMFNQENVNIDFNSRDMRNVIL